MTAILKSSTDQNKILLLFPLLLVFLGSPKPAFAGIEFLSTPSPQQTAGGSVVFEDTRFRFSSDRKPVSFHFSGSSYQPWGLNSMGTSTAVLDHAYVKLPHVLGTDLSLGRLRSEGGELLDGLHARMLFSSTSALSFFAGSLAESANNITSGKFSWQFGGGSRLGISSVSESAGPRRVREEAAVEFRLYPLGKTVLSGVSRFNFLTDTWSEHSYSVKVGPFRKATMLFDASLLDFGAASRGTDSSAQFLAVGAGVRYPFSPRLAVGFDVRRTEDPYAGVTVSERMRFSFSSLRTWSAGFSMMRQKGENLDILEMTANATKKSGRLEAFLNLQKTVDETGFSINRNSASTSLGLTYELGSAYRLIADMQRTSSSYAQVDSRGFFKLEYRFGS